MTNVEEEINIPTIMEHNGDNGMHLAKHQHFLTPFIMGSLFTIVFMWIISKYEKKNCMNLSLSCKIYVLIKKNLYGK